MRVSVIGTGYVGLVAGACLAEKGHQVTCIDVDPVRVSHLCNGCLPFHEPDLDDLVQRQLKAGTLSFSEDLTSAVSNSQMVFVTVGTPSCEDGSVDLSAVLAVAEDIGRAMKDYLVIVVKSTVPVGTAELVRYNVAQYAKADFAVVSNPEFLREGQAIRDFLHPDRVIIGGADENAVSLLRQLYAPFTDPERILVMDSRSAEMAKYVANAFLATRVSFINEIAALCEESGADIEHVRYAAGMDPRVGLAYFSPGLGYGGSCLPKDLRAVLSLGQRGNMHMELLPAVQRVNSLQPLRLLRKISEHFEGVLIGRCITVWGLSFKAGTDDLRESPSIALIQGLVSAGATVTAYDPQANGAARSLLGAEVMVSDDQYACLQGAEALVVATEWDEFRRVDLSRVRELMRHPILFDARNIYDPATLKQAGFNYYGVGRSNHVERPLLLKN